MARQIPFKRKLFSLKTKPKAFIDSGLKRGVRTLIFCCSALEWLLAPYREEQHSHARGCMDSIAYTLSSPLLWLQSNKLRNTHSNSVRKIIIQHRVHGVLTKNNRRIIRWRFGLLPRKKNIIKNSKLILVKSFFQGNCWIWLVFLVLFNHNCQGIHNYIFFPTLCVYCHFEWLTRSSHLFSLAGCCSICL